MGSDPRRRGGVGGVNEPETMFMHNSWRPTDRSVQAEGVESGNILIGTEEEFNDDCESDGRLVVSDLTDSWGGEPALNSTPAAPYRMKPLDTFHPAQDTPETVSARRRRAPRTTSSSRSRRSPRRGTPRACG